MPLPQAEAILDVWYGFVGAKPNAEYLSRVRARFGQWIKDTTGANYDQTWLDHQCEFGLRHTRLGTKQGDF